MRRRWLGPAGAVVALVAGFGLVAGSAVAAPNAPDEDDIAAVDAAADDTEQQIAALEAELATNAEALEAADIAAAVAVEDHLQAQVELEDAQAAEAAAATAATEADAELDAATAGLAELAMASYRSGGDLAQLGMLLSADGIEDALADATTYQVLGESSAAAEQRFADAQTAATVAQERSNQAVLAREEAAAELEVAAESAQQAADNAAQVLASNQAQFDQLVAQLAELRQTSIDMEAERQSALQAERDAAQNAASAAALGVSAPAPDQQSTAPAAQPSPAPPTAQPAAPATTQPPAVSTPRPTTPAPTTKPPAPPPAPAPSTSANAGALAWAKTQLGKPYIWGGTGPRGYDCSGLTLKAYASVGIGLPRNSRAQYGAGDLVPVSQMRPGDLIFYSSNGKQSGIYHVAIYAGNGMRVHAPSAGKTVEYVPMWWRNVMPYVVRP
ncbi:MAG: C40 family peptidase [Beutenbergiaceae bacterium]